MLGGTPYYSSISNATLAMLNGADYALWHNPQKIITRARRHFTNAPHELVIRAIQADLESFASLRNRVAHGQDDAKDKCNVATMRLAGRRYPGAKAGHFLRDWDRRTGPPVRWLESITDTLVTFSGMIV
jgi:hypothetical protein